MPVFEAVTLASVALGGTLVLFVSQRTIDASDALRIHLLMGTFMALLLTFYVPYEHALRYWLAVAGVPLASRATNWLFKVHPADRGSGTFILSPGQPGSGLPGKPHQP